MELPNFLWLTKVTTFTYDASGNQLSVRDPNGVGQDVVYDALGRAGLTTDTAGDTTNSTYDKSGNRIAAMDGKNMSTTYVYDARNRQKSQKDRLNGTTSFAYLATGQLASLTDAQSQTTSYTYDDAGNKLTEQYPDHTGGSPGNSIYGIVTFTNDAAGRVLRKQDQLGDTATYIYDLAGRLTQRDYRTLVNSPSGTIADSDTFTYDRASRMLTAVSGRYSNTVTYTYDNAGRKATEALTISGQTYSISTGYDAKGQLTSYTYPDGTAVGRSYTDRGELYQLTHASSTIDTRTYDDGGRMTGSSYGNGVSESRSYNTDNTVSNISYAGASIGSLSYSWDDNKNKTGESISGTLGGFGFSIPVGGYDAEDRLVAYNRTDGNLDQSWSLSAVGDWNSVTTEGSTQSRTHGPTHELLTAAGQNVSTDVKGNITLIPASLRPQAVSLSWDMDNRLSTADVGNNSSVDVTYKFDALGRRVYRDDGTTAMVYVQSGQQTIADYVAGTSSTSPTHRYVYASYIDEPVLRIKPSASESLYYHRNQQYSITALTNASGTILERYAYSAYGVPTITDAAGTPRSSSSYANRYTYTGREWDDVLLMYHFRARMYDAKLGRFCSRDPMPSMVVGRAVRTEPNYEYLRGSPVNSTDPRGLCPFDGEDWDDGNPYDGNYGKRRVRCRIEGGRRVYECRTNTQNPDYDLDFTNGCTVVGGGPYNFDEACNAHDRCWNACGGDKGQCNDQFLNDMIDTCSANDPSLGTDFANCVTAASLYLQGVSREFPVVGDVYEQTQDDSCSWEPCTISCTDLGRNRPFYPSSYPWPWIPSRWCINPYSGKKELCSDPSRW